jgi:hypothetical protein
LRQRACRASDKRKLKAPAIPDCSKLDCFSGQPFPAYLRHLAGEHGVPRWHCAVVGTALPCWFVVKLEKRAPLDQSASRVMPSNAGHQVQRGVTPRLSGLAEEA